MSGWRGEIWCGRHSGGIETGAEAGAAPKANTRPFALPGAPKRFGRDRTGALRRLKADVRLDFGEKKISGTVTHTIEALAGGLREVALDACALTITGARVDGATAVFHHDGEKLRVVLPSPAEQGATIEVAVDYHGHPTRGLYFVGPDAHNPTKPVHAWTQGQDEDSRYWLPCPDYPDQRTATEIIARVPPGNSVLSNGVLVTSGEIDGESVWHWKQDDPHVTYLMTLAAGPFSIWEETAGGVPLSFYVLPGQEEDGKRAMGNTGAMIEHFNQVLGVPYPWAKYAQIVVADFVMGGMENTSATTLTDLTLHDARAHADYRSDHLISHELAHQWFGDLVTCRTWSHAWLNEGFATFMETVWAEHHDGPDEAVYDRFRDGEDYFGEDAVYRRPVVERDYEAPQDIFDCHLYQKAGRILHTLRSVLGAGVFWAGVRTYLERHRGGMVETNDLRRALEDVSGRDLGRFFDDWIHHGGHPDLKLAYSYAAADGAVELTLSQTQTPDAVTPRFRLDVPVSVHTAAGETRITVPLSDDAGESRTVHVRVDGPPTMVRVDPGDTILKTLKLELPFGLLKTQLTDDPDPIGRIRAAHTLAKPAKVGGVEAVAEALRTDPFWGVRAECAKALGACKHPAALEALTAAAQREEHPKARRAIAGALGHFRDARAVEALRPLAAGDPSYYVCSTALQSLGQTRQPGVLADLEGALAHDSHADTIRCGALRGMGALRDPAALPVLRGWTADDRSEQARGAATSGLATLARHADERLRAEIRDDLAELARDRSLRVRMNAVRGLGALGDGPSAAVLRAVRDGDAEARVRRTAGQQLRRLGTAPGAQVREVQDAFETLRTDHGKLAARVQELETLLGRGPGGAPSGGSGSGTTPTPNGETA